MLIVYCKIYICNENYGSFLTLLIIVDDLCLLTYYVITILSDITNRITYDNCALLRKHFYIINSFIKETQIHNFSQYNSITLIK